jgi:hypothetical protein
MVWVYPGLPKLNPGLKFANAFSVIFSNLLKLAIFAIFQVLGPMLHDVTAQIATLTQF